ncbi:hypothetical protein CEP88_10020 [Roseobacter denitrificans]|uniref:Uncharacterized protein n=1 Tax=Roseobacter denitrificans (strain ATCC 33942 / OCh 114) TaxID=375451 RepID=Q160I9_ROSDO|nr:hypothetical protein [Roseobacter denitrificans]ABG33604.1 hypothetical protein RD1_4165 [Roseobacter denitrificans OCh 114]AVL52906.1 hypothetical protein CEP88_10020 [Roseobacter denitrificans]SFG03737.1 hypothetical protein SAMN05443635_10671 [Roseobacter denitrificans OCh 114]
MTLVRFVQVVARGKGRAWTMMDATQGVMASILTARAAPAAVQGTVHPSDRSRHAQVATTRAAGLALWTPKAAPTPDKAHQIAQDLWDARHHIESPSA